MTRRSNEPGEILSDALCLCATAHGVVYLPGRADGLFSASSFGAGAQLRSRRLYVVLFTPDTDWVKIPFGEVVAFRLCAGWLTVLEVSRGPHPSVRTPESGLRVGDSCPHLFLPSGELVKASGYSRVGV